MSVETTLARFRAAATLPTREWTTQYPGHRPMAVFCTYVPEEVLHAAGFTPVRVLRDVRRTSEVRRTCPPSSGAWGEHLQSYTCPLVRSLLEQGADGYLAEFAGAVFAHSCDAMQALADIWKLRFPDSFVWVVNHPTRLDSPHTLPYLLAELERFRSALETRFGVSINEGNLSTSIALHDRVRRLLQRLDTLRDRISVADFYAAVLAAQTMPKEEFAPLLEALLPELEAHAPRADSVRVVIAGAILDDLTLPSLADDLGIAIAGDDLCTSARFFDGQAAPDLPPLEALAARSLQRAPCAAKHRDGYHRGEALLRLAQERGAQGVIFYLQKFCEPHAFDFGQAQRFLQDAGLAVLLLEDDAGAATAQWRTRLQAFAEMLAGEAAR